MHPRWRRVALADNVRRMELIIFDFDGVIADSEVIANAVLAEGLTALGHPTSIDDCLRLYMGRRWVDCALAIEAEIGRRLPDDFVTAQRQAIRARAAGELEAVAGAADFVRGLGGRQRCIASSSSLEWLALCLGRFGLAEHFGANLFSAAVHVERGKPHPDLFLHAARSMGVDPARTLVIEDSPLGVEAGVAAGMTVIGLLAGGHVGAGHEARLAKAGAHYIARTYDDVRAILRLLTA